MGMVSIFHSDSLRFAKNPGFDDLIPKIQEEPFGFPVVR
jgi:hypothetical protein